MKDEVALDIQQLHALLEKEIIPYVEMHGGRLELVDVDGWTVRLRLGGACHSCSAQMMTLRIGIERLLRRAINPLIRVEHVRS